jgi:hypothetical protein
MAISHCTKKAVWPKQLLANMGYMQEELKSIMSNNQECIAFAKNSKHHSCTKHIDVQHHSLETY